MTGILHIITSIFSTCMHIENNNISKPLHVTCHILSLVNSTLLTDDMIPI